MSDYNVFHERLLDAGLGTEEWQLAIALVRLLLGFRVRSQRVGEDLLRESSRLHHGRSFKRARDGLIYKGLLSYEPPEHTGRGHRGTYTLLFGDETPASERDIASETPAGSPAQTPAQTPAIERARIEEGGESRESLTDCHADAADATPREYLRSEPTSVEDETDHALQELVDSLEDADSGTLLLFRKRFGRLDADEVYDVLASVDQRPDVRSDAGYAYRLLDNALAGRRCQPEEFELDDDDDDDDLPFTPDIPEDA